MNNKFYTLTGYKRKEGGKITSAMEDYLEMIYRMHIKHEELNIKNISRNLHVKYPSTTKMINRLNDSGFINYEKYKDISITKKGINYGKYLLNRHETLVYFFRVLNKDKYKLEQVEKIEHFIDKVTIENIKSFLKKIESSTDSN